MSQAFRRAHAPAVLWRCLPLLLACWPFANASAQAPAGSPTAQITVSPAVLAFGSVQVGSSKTLTVRVSNPGSRSVRLFFSTPPNSRVSLATAGSPRCGGNGSTLQARSACYQAFRYEPRAAGTLSGAITITATGQGSPQVRTVTLTGTATPVPRPVLSVSPASLEISGICKPRTHATGSVTATNTGNATLRITSVYLEGRDAGFKLTQRCTSSVAPAGTCTVTVSYDLRSPGTRRATLYIQSNAGQQRVPVTAACTPPVSP